MPKYWERSQSVERDNNDERAEGCKAYFFAAGTTTPLTTYSDGDQTTPRTHPVVADAYGRWPAVFIPFSDAGYRLRIITSGGVELCDVDDIPNADPVDAAGSVTDDEKLQVGHIHCEMIDAVKDGFVRLNGRSIGNAASGATERANADTADLYSYLWDNLADGQAAVSGGRGATAAADYAANKAIALPDFRGAVPVGLDTMGNSAASLLGGAPVVNGSTTAPGSILGANTHALTTGELASHSHAVGTLATASDGAHVHTLTEPSAGGHNHGGVTGSTAINYADKGNNVNAGVNGGELAPNANQSTPDGHSHSISTDGAHTHGTSVNSGGAHTHTLSGSTATSGSGTAHNNLSRGVLVTWYAKL